MVWRLEKKKIQAEVSLWIALLRFILLYIVKRSRVSLTDVVMQVDEDERTTTILFWLWSLDAIVETAVAWLARLWGVSLVPIALELGFPVVTPPPPPKEVCLITRTLPAGSNTTTCLILVVSFFPLPLPSLNVDVENLLPPNVRRSLLIHPCDLKPSLRRDLRRLKLSPNRCNLLLLCAHIYTKSVRDIKSVVLEDDSYSSFACSLPTILLLPLLLFRNITENQTHAFVRYLREPQAYQLGFFRKANRWRLFLPTDDRTAVGSLSLFLSIAIPTPCRQMGVCGI